MMGKIYWKEFQFVLIDRSRKTTMQQRIFFTLLIALSAEISYQFPTGAPASRCNTLYPSHEGAVSREFPSPYEIFPSASVVGNGHSINVEIRSVDANRQFAGFILQARTTSDPYEIVGEFQETGPPFVFRDCSGHRTTATNANNIRSSSLTFEWAAPREFTGIVRFQ